MERRDNDEKLMIQYLLGELSDEERHRVEERFFADDEYFDLLSAVEDDLIDAYARNKLSPIERARFEQRFLASARQQRRVEFAKAFRRALSEAPAVSAVEPVADRRAPAAPVRRQPILQMFQTRVFKFALAAVLILAVGSAWLLVRTLRLQAELARVQQHTQQQIARLRSEQETLRQREQSLRQEAAEARARRDELAGVVQQKQDEIDRLEEELVRRPSSQPLPFDLAANSTRGIGRPSLRIRPGAQLVQVRLELEGEGKYPRFHVVLRAGGSEVVRQHGLSERSTELGAIVIWNLPASVFTPGSYEIELSGVTAEGVAEIIDYYSFTVVRH